MLLTSNSFLLLLVRHLLLEAMHLLLVAFFPIANMVTTSKARVTRSDALVTRSYALVTSDTRGRVPARRSLYPPQAFPRRRIASFVGRPKTWPGAFSGAFRRVATRHRARFDFFSRMIQSQTDLTGWTNVSWWFD